MQIMPNFIVENKCYKMNDLMTTSLSRSFSNNVILYSHTNSRLEKAHKLRTHQTLIDMQILHHCLRTYSKLPL